MPRPQAKTIENKHCRFYFLTSSFFLYLLSYLLATHMGCWDPGVRLYPPRWPSSPENSCASERYSHFYGLGWVAGVHYLENNAAGSPRGPSSNGLLDSGQDMTGPKQAAVPSRADLDSTKPGVLILSSCSSGTMILHENSRIPPHP